MHTHTFPLPALPASPFLVHPPRLFSAFRRRRRRAQLEEACGRETWQWQVRGGRRRSAEPAQPEAPNCHILKDLNTRQQMVAAAGRGATWLGLKTAAEQRERARRSAEEARERMPGHRAHEEEEPVGEGVWAVGCDLWVMICGL